MESVRPRVRLPSSPTQWGRQCGCGWGWIQLARGGLLAALVMVGLSCQPGNRSEVVVYCALDREFSEPILRQFEAETGVRVLAKYDVESTKTVGLANALLAERQRPRCDLFWNNEILHTLRLQREGLLAGYAAAAAAPFPTGMKSAEGRWYGFAARARILLVNTRLVAESERPDSILALVDTRWEGKCGVARPVFGTTATHAAVLHQLWGEQRAREFWQQAQANARVLSGNKQVASLVAEGRLAFGLTDTDDAYVELSRGSPVAIVYPDQGPGQPGALRIPNTLSLLRGSPHTLEARRLLEYLLSPAVEAQLAQGASAQLPVNPQVQARSPVAPTEPIRWMEADFEAAAADWDEVASYLRGQFGG